MPYLVCDPYSTDEIQPDDFEVVIDSEDPIISSPEVLEDDSVRLYYDLSGVSKAVLHKVFVVAIKDDAIYGELYSDPAEYEFGFEVPERTILVWS